jgi:hypothetical protein
MTASHLKTGAEPTPETSCISNIPHKIMSYFGQQSEVEEREQAGGTTEKISIK